MGEVIKGAGVFPSRATIAEKYKELQGIAGGEKKILMRFVAFKEFEMCQHNVCFDTA